MVYSYFLTIEAAIFAFTFLLFVFIRSTEREVCILVTCRTVSKPGAGILCFVGTRSSKSQNNDLTYP